MKLANSPEILSAAVNTIIVAVVSTLIATILGTLLALGVERRNASSGLDALLFAPMIIPDIVLAIALLSFFTLLEVTLGLYSIILSHVVFNIAFVCAILLDGKDMAGLGANRRPINLMFQSYALFPHMSVRGNISYGLEMERLTRREITRRVDEILEQTQLTALTNRKPVQLSGGQGQRVALARARQTTANIAAG